MKQVFLSGAGTVDVMEAPVPGRLAGSALVRNAYSCISSGTEGAAVTRQSGLRGIYEKATGSRDRVEQVWAMAKRDGVLKTYDAVTNKLQEFLPIGYSSAGIVVETDSELFPFRPGARVACMGAGFANHAEYVTVPRNMLAQVPETVPLDQAAFAAIACTAIQGIRRLELSPGEIVGVIGLGLIGQIAARLLDAMGYGVVVTDLDPRRVADATAVEGVSGWTSGAGDGGALAMRVTGGRGLDGIVICAATDSSGPVNEAFDLLRPRGRVSIVGDVGLDLERAKMYSKELEVRLSCSYGPGRYDPAYEIRGEDYPLSHVRWTAGRNLEFFLHLLGSGRLSLAALIGERFPVDEAKQAYQRVKQGGGQAILFDYEAGEAAEAPPPESRIVRRPGAAVAGAGERIGLGIVGVGSFVRGMHLPNIARLSDMFALHGMASRSGGPAAAAARRYGAEIATSDYRELLDAKDIDAVVVGTRHAAHARIVLDALDAGKHVFVEKPMTTTVEDGEAVVAKARETGLVVRVGFNRRFSPMMRRLREAVGPTGPSFFFARANIGSLAGDWSNAPEEGGRFLGEATHFLDLCNWFMGATPSALSASFVDPGDVQCADGQVLVAYPDGSSAQVLYTTLGHVAMGKEYFEVFANGRSGRLDDYAKLSLNGANGAGRMQGAKKGDKGHLETLREFAMAIRGEPGDGADAVAGYLATWMAVEARNAALQQKTVRCPS